MGEYKVNPVLYCKYCGKNGHIIDNCPERKPRVPNLAEKVPNKPVLVPNVDNVVPNSERKQDRWKRKNRESYLAKQRELMKAYRAKKRGG